MLPASRLKGIKSKWNRNHHTKHGSAWIKTANSLKDYMLHQKTNEWHQKSKRTSWAKCNLCKIGALVHHQTYSSKKIDKKRSKWKDLCSGMPKRDSCSRNQLFHLEILSLPWSPLCYFIWIIFSLFRAYSGFTAWWEHFAVAPCVMQIRCQYTPWDMSVLGLKNGPLLKLLHLATQVRHTTQAASALLEFSWKQVTCTDPPLADFKHLKKLKVELSYEWEAFSLS